MNMNMNLGKAYSFTYQGIEGNVRCYPSGARDIAYGGARFEYIAADSGLKTAIDAAIAAKKVAQS